MTDTHTTTPQNKNSKSHHDAIMMLADELKISVENNGPDTSMKLLRAQVKSLAKLHHLMSLEAGRFMKERGHDLQRLSMALRAQNQFCRTLMVLDHLEQRELEKQKMSNELITKDFDNEIKPLDHA